MGVSNMAGGYAHSWMVDFMGKKTSINGTQPWIFPRDFP